MEDEYMGRIVNRIIKNAHVSVSLGILKEFRFEDGAYLYQMCLQILLNCSVSRFSEVL